MLQLISIGDVELPQWLNGAKGISTNVLANVIFQIQD